MNKMLHPQQLHQYQREAIMHQISNDHSMLWLGMGLGKTGITLTTIIDRMRAGQVKKTLIFGPLRVIQSVWTREIVKWEHTRHLRCSIMHGSRNARAKALHADADIYLINYENMNWLVEQLHHYYLNKGLPLPFEMVVFDEVSKLKSSTSMRMKGGRRDVVDEQGKTHTIRVLGWRTLLDEIPYRTGLTGTPASNGYLDLFGQYLAVDGGVRLGEYVTHYRNSFFTSDYNGWAYEPTDEGMRQIEARIEDITIKMDSRDYLDMPDCKVTDILVELPAAARRVYDEVERAMFAELDSGTELEVFSRAAVSNKCCQISNGSAYLSPESREYEVIHKAKLDALDEIMEEAAGSPVLCSYLFKADAERIMQTFRKYKPVNLTETDAKDTGTVIDRWVHGDIKLMVGHSSSVGHGIDGLQTSGHIVVWYGVNWSLELYDQMNGRINRQGQEHPVSILRILCNDTVDLAVVDAIEHKTDTQEGLKNAIQRYRDRHETPLTFL